MRKDNITPTCRLCGQPRPNLENGLCANCSPAALPAPVVGRDGTVWLTSTQTATMLGITRQTLLDWWTKWRKGPPFIRPGVRGDRRYRLEDVEAFLRVNH